MQTRSPVFSYDPMDTPQKITIAGVGYVGFSLAVLLSQQHSVTAVTTTPSKAESINCFQSPIRDTLIEQYLAEAASGNRNLHLTATTDGHTAYADADVIIIAVPTNYDPTTNAFDCSAVESVLRLIHKATNNHGNRPIVVIKSTVPVGYTSSIRHKLDLDNLLFCPEFLRESKALYDNLYPSRIVIGCDESTQKAAQYYSSLIRQSALKNDVPVLITGYSEAEAIKLFVNTFLALRISFFNELDTYSECHELNTRDIINGVCMDPRVGGFYNNPSFGYGGYCLPKDTLQLLANYSDIPENLIRAVIDSNSTRKAYVADRVSELVAKKAVNNKPVIGVYRLTMKSDSDNFRNSAIRDIIDQIRDRGITLVIYEPLLEDGSIFRGNEVVNDLSRFKKISTCIIANRYDPVLDDVAEKVYSRDLFGRD